MLRDQTETDMLNLAQNPMIRVIDTETTGVGDDAALVEIGYVDLTQHGGGVWAVGDPVGVLTNPGRPIPPEASAVHHIKDRDVADAPSPDRVFAQIHNPKITHFAAHNVAFDRRFFGGGNAEWICTLKSAYRAFPGAPAHNNQTLRYLVDLDASEDFDPAKAEPPHRAAADAYVTAFLLRFLLENGLSVERLTEWTGQPSVLPNLLFGKHKGKSWAEVPIDYLQWLIGQRDMDADVKHTARHWIDKRSSI